ncbi:hypothetical protein RF11_00758 [Thelohanellus kitauei]|uniref:Uncharacterized protein n=1 Tax=Thelohanellus kitauei TaxID=669202 RepID=A0A0C2JNB1_THEKT|nr:hypothetical protein RF11_00758 [Thelohanellus kitauei]
MSDMPLLSLYSLHAEDDTVYLTGPFSSATTVPDIEQAIAIQGQTVSFARILVSSISADTQFIRKLSSPLILQLLPRISRVRFRARHSLSTPTRDSKTHNITSLGLSETDIAWFARR